MLPRAVARAAAFTAVIGLTAATPTLVANPASAGTAARSAVTCPTVTNTGVVSPPPSSGVDWSGCDLSGADFSSADLSNANLSDSNMFEANLTGADLANANMIGAELLVGRIVDANLNGTDLAGADLTSVISGGITGTPAALPVTWTLADGFLLGPTAELIGDDLAGAQLAGVDLEGADLLHADLSGANMTGADLTDARLTEAKVGGTNFAGAILSGAISGQVSGQPADLPANWSTAGGYLNGPSAFLSGADLSALDLNSAHLAGADLHGADLSSASLENADLSNVDLGFADLTGTDLRGANLTGANISGVRWDNTICTDGSNSDKHVAGCPSPLDITPPLADPEVSGSPGQDGWFVSPLSVEWGWTDNGTIVAADCTMQTNESRNGPHALQATCDDLAGNQGAASIQVKIDATRPAVRVTGVQGRHVYRAGKVPAAHCSTSEHVSGVRTPARLTITTTGSQGVGAFTAICSGAESVAGLPQAHSVRAHYTIAYGLHDFGKPRPGSTIRPSQRRIHVVFRLANAAGRPLTGSRPQQLAAWHHVQVRLTGPGIAARTAACWWNEAAAHFGCTLRIPAAVQAHKSYHITARENTGSGFVEAPSTPTGRDPEVVRFR